MNERSRAYESTSPVETGAGVLDGVTEGRGLGSVSAQKNELVMVVWSVADIHSRQT